MKILFIIALVSFAVLAWAAFAITRHIRENTANKEPESLDGRQQIHPVRPTFGLRGTKVGSADRTP